MTSSSHLGAWQFVIIFLLFLLLFHRGWVIRCPETCEGGADWAPPEAASASEHRHDKGKVIGGGRGGGRGEVPLNQPSLLSGAGDCVIKTECQKTSNKHLSGEKNGEDLIQLRNTCLNGVGMRVQVRRQRQTKEHGEPKNKQISGRV